MTPEERLEGLVLIRQRQRREIEQIKKRLTALEGKYRAATEGLASTVSGDSPDGQEGTKARE